MASTRHDRPAAPPEDVESLGPDADAEAVARRILLDQLSGRARSRAELATSLRRRGVPRSLAESLLDRFQELGLVDDGAFARMWVESRGRGRGLGRRTLAVELRRRGVDDETVRDALAEVDPDEEAESARRLVRRRLPSVRTLSRETAIRRLTGMLARKGHPPAVVTRVVLEELTAAGLETHDPDWSSPPEYAADDPADDPADNPADDDDTTITMTIRRR